MFRCQGGLPLVRALLTVGVDGASWPGFWAFTGTSVALDAADRPMVSRGVHVYVASAREATISGALHRFTGEPRHNRTDDRPDHLRHRPAEADRLALDHHPAGHRFVAPPGPQRPQEAPILRGAGSPGAPTSRIRVATLSAATRAASSRV